MIGDGLEVRIYLEGKHQSFNARLLENFQWILFFFIWANRFINIICLILD